jgi:drug/metabolite transporter, DME family
VSPAVLALGAALGFALAGILLRRALVFSTPRTAALVSVTFTAICVWAAALVSAPLALLFTWAVLPFVAAGIAAPGIGRLMLYTGVGRVGAARTSAMVASTPFFSVAMATALLGEHPTPSMLVGAACVVAGGVLLATRVRDERPWRRRDLLFPVLAAASFGLRDIFVRSGLTQYPHPLIAAAVATGTSVVVMWALAAAGGRRAFALPRAGLGFMAIAGVCESVAYVTMLRALAVGDVSLVSPLAHAQPFFTVALALLFLRDLERVTWRVVVASALVVAGAVVLVRFGTGGA